MPNLVLTGFMGTGKTTVGKKLARRLGMKFTDTDHEIERITGMTVNDIFQKHGEVRFRSEEKAAVKRVARFDGQVIATGGGVVLDPENLSVLRENGVIVCLTADPEIIYQRLKNKKNRPLLKTEAPREIIQQKLEERSQAYKNADETVDTSNLALDQVVEEVIRFFRSKLT